MTEDGKVAQIAKALWHRFGNPNVIEWDDETHKAEYFDAAWQVFVIASKEDKCPTTP
jgi:hypothetical protein